MVKNVKIKLPLPQEKKLSVICRVEPGCLGSDGAKHIEAFCSFAQKEYAPIDADFIHWEITPRLDKSLAEMQYRVGDRGLTHAQAARYLALFEKDLDQFEESMHLKLGDLIEQHLGR